MKPTRLTVPTWIALAAALVLASPAAAQFSFDPNGGGFNFPDPLGESATVSAQDGPKVTATARYTPAVDGQSAMVEITAQIAEGYHVYAVDQPKGGPLGVQLTLDSSSDWNLVGEWTTVTPPKIKRQPDIWGDLPLMEHYGEAVWRAPIEIKPGVDPATANVSGKISAQVCSESTCLPPSDAPFTADLAEVGSIMPVVALPPLDETAAGNAEAIIPSSDTALVTEDKSSLITVLAGAFLGGLILNLMPCVLPVIGLKVLSFAEQAGHDRGKVLAMNLAYSAGLMAVFILLACLAAFASYGWGELYTITEFKVGMVVLVFAMALSFLGVWEIPIPGFAGGKGANELQQKEGYAGAFYKGIFTTILATPCSGPFLGPALGETLKWPAPYTFLIFSTVGLGMASPYLLIGMFPGLVKALPKPGAWMETFKQLMGFVLMGTVVFLIMGVSEAYYIPILATLVGVGLACWWIGSTPITAGSSKRIQAWIGGVATSFIIGWGTFTLLGPNENELPWQPYSPAALVQAQAEGKTVLVDFTANWCQTCKVNSKYAINTEKIRSVVEENDVTPLLADWTDHSPVIKQALEDLGSRSIPFLVVYPANRPDEPILLPDVITESQLLAALAEAGAVAGNAEGVTPTIEIGEAATGTFR